MVRFFRPATRLGAWLGRLFTEGPRGRRIALVFALTELITLAWDLPGSHGWENDGIAPRDLFGGLANNLDPVTRIATRSFTISFWRCPASRCSSPPRSPARSAADAVRDRVLSVPTMTSLSVIAKLVATAMAVVTLVVLARIVRRTVGERAGRFAALFAATNLTFAFYGRVSNLDVPYLFWTVLALDRLLDMAETRQAP